MNFPYSILISPFIIFVSLLFGLSLIGKNPKEILKPFTVICVAISLVYICVVLLFTMNYYYFGFLVLLVYIIQKGFKLSLPSSMVVVLLSSILFMFHIFLEQMMSNYFSRVHLDEESDVYISLVTIVIYAAVLGITIYSKRLIFFSNKVDFDLISEGNLGKNFIYSLFPTIFTLSFMFLWTLYCINNLSLYKIEQQLIIFLFTVILFIVLIYFMKIFYFYINQKIEGFIEKKNQEELLNFMQVIRSQRHDFNFHLQAIFGMLENKRYSECTDYVRAIVDEVSDLNEVLPLYHPAVGALLSTFREMAAHKRIKLEISIYYNLSHIPCTVSEINKVIGNLVQNAIDEVEQYPANERWIQVMILKRSGKSVIKVTNRSNNEISSYKNIFNLGYSTKPSHEGIGLTTVQKIVTKYDGTVHLEFEDDMVHFIVQIPNAPAMI